MPQRSQSAFLGLFIYFISFFEASREALFPFCLLWILILTDRWHQHLWFDPEQWSQQQQSSIWVPAWNTANWDLGLFWRLINSVCSHLSVCIKWILSKQKGIWQLYFPQTVLESLAFQKISAVSLVESPLYSKHYDRALKIRLEEIKLIGPK